ncbi:tail fiber protein [Paenibacillus chibensis]|uniref:Tail fiber protein n=1 Tax=Paenibacillus chibensis TaxID=59846 RepID=A0ABU6PQX1_9BACL|nr:tail fiber protein [Paenibacillus chibensis]
MSDNYLGEIRMFGGNYPPQGWLFCDGTLLSINDNEALFTLLGTTYGGDGRTTFALPDLRGRLPLHRGTNPQDGSVYVLGQRGGTETVTLLNVQLPSHTHPVQASKTSGNSSDPSNRVWGVSGDNRPYTSTNPNGTMSSTAIQPRGGSQPHDNMMPYLPISFIISTTGVYPSQN